MNDSVKSLVEVSTRTINGKEVLAVTSLQVAKHFEKEHKHVLRDIRIILEADEDGFSESNFGLSSYLTEQNKEMPMYVMSKDGFVLLVMGYTGPEAMRMKKAYIARFNEMEEQLRAASPLLPNFRDPSRQPRRGLWRNAHGWRNRLVPTITSAPRPRLVLAAKQPR